MNYLIEDTRQKENYHQLKHEHFNEVGINVIRCKLPFGDYSRPPAVAVDTKENMDEICNNICGKSHTRFVNECKSAQAAGCKLIILVENDLGIDDISQVHTWINPRVIYSPKCPQGSQLQKAMYTLSERYGVEFRFCRPEDSGKVILELLGYGNGRTSDNV